METSQGFIPGMFGVSHGAIQFMVYEELKNWYNNYLNAPIDSKLVSRTFVEIKSVGPESVFE